MPNEKHFFYPDSRDDMWNVECESLIPYLRGNGVDIGSGTRSIFKEDMRVDADEKTNPQFSDRGDKLPFEDGKFDYLYSIHSFEHFDDQEKTINEWIRVIKRGGIIAIVHPDIEFTGPQLPADANPDKNPFNKHTFERTYAQFMDWLKLHNYFNLKLLDSGVACGHWSFYVILKKNGLS